MHLVEGTTCCFWFWSSGHSETASNPQLVQAATSMAANSVQEGVNLQRGMVGVEEPLFVCCAFQLLHFGLAPWMPRSPTCGVCASGI